MKRLYGSSCRHCDIELMRATPCLPLTSSYLTEWFEQLLGCIPSSSRDRNGADCSKSSFGVSGIFLAVLQTLLGSLSRNRDLTSWYKSILTGLRWSGWMWGSEQLLWEPFFPFLFFSCMYVWSSRRYFGPAYLWFEFAKVSFSNLKDGIISPFLLLL